MTLTKPITKAGRLLLLYRLREAGVTEGKTLQHIGDILGVNRSTILRDLRVLDQVEDEYRRLMQEQPWLNRSRKNILQATGYSTITDAAKETGYFYDHIGLLCRKGKIKAEKVGNRWWVHLRSLKEYASTKVDHGMRGPHKLRRQ